MSKFITIQEEIINVSDIINVPLPRGKEMTIYLRDRTNLTFEFKSKETASQLHKRLQEFLNAVAI